MTDAHDRLPDPAALDELSRAFRDHESVAGRDDAGRDAGRDAGTGSAVPVADEGDLTAPGEAVADPTAPADGGSQVDAAGPNQPVEDPDGAVVVRAHDDRPVIRIDAVDEPAAPDGRGDRDQHAGSGAGADEPDAPAVIAIDDADLPDAVYIEGSLSAGSDRPVVLIEDSGLDADDEEPAVAPEAARRRGIEPRLRERRVAVKRAEGLRRLRWVIVAAVVLIVVVGVLAVLGSGWFAVQREQIAVTGAVYTDPDRLAEIVDDLAGTAALRVDTDRIEAELESIPWVEDARVVVDFPSRATIEIREREAVATYQGPDLRYRVLDRDGRVLDVIDGYPFAYVLVAGPDPVDLQAGDFAPQGYAAAAELARTLTPTVRGRVERIEVTSSGSDLTMFLDDGRPIRFGEARELFAKLVRLERVLTTGEEYGPGPIDVSTREVTVPGVVSGSPGGDR